MAVTHSGNVREDREVSTAVVRMKTGAEVTTHITSTAMAHRSVATRGTVMICYGVDAAAFTAGECKLQKQDQKLSSLVQKGPELPSIG
jgi:hypothetical protein